VDDREAVYIISVAARLVDMHPSTLRKYERCGLLDPCRQGGRLRLYSPDDIARLRQIKTLVEERGTNVKGVELALAVTERVRLLLRMAEHMPDDARFRHQARALANDVLRILGADEREDSPASLVNEANSVTKST